MPNSLAQAYAERMLDILLGVDGVEESSLLRDSEEGLAMTKVIYRAEIFPEGDCYVGLCRELDVTSFGDDLKDASDSLHEAVELFLEGCEELRTLDEVLVESGFQKVGDEWKLRESISENMAATIQGLHGESA